MVTKNSLFCPVELHFTMAKGTVGRQGEEGREGEIATQLNNSFGFRQANQTSLSDSDEGDVWKKERKLQGHT